MDTLRTFVAIDIKIEETLIKHWDELKTIMRFDQVKWVDNRNFHLTLYFLGETKNDLIPLINKGLSESLADMRSFSIQLKGFGCFGNPSTPKVLWVGVENSSELAKLKSEINNILNPFGFEEEKRDFSPHLTLGRVKEMKPSAELKGFIQSKKDLFFQEIAVNEVVFYQSVLRSEGPIYKPLKTFRLLSP